MKSRFVGLVCLVALALVIRDLARYGFVKAVATWLLAAAMSFVVLTIWTVIVAIYDRRKARRCTR